METARVIARGEEMSTPKWDPEDQVANRLREIRTLASQAQEHMEWGELPDVTKKLKGISYLIKCALELQARSRRRAR